LNVGNAPRVSRVSVGMSKPGTQPARAGHRRLRRAALALVALVAGYVALVIHPQPLFAYTLQRGNLVLHARRPLPPEATPMLDDALARVSRSPIYDAARTHDVFLCDTSGLYAFFSLWNHRSGGITHTWAGGNAFIRPADVRRGRVMGASGVEKGGARTLTYYVAHEVTHAMSVDRAGRWRFKKLAAFQTEGYADYVAFAQPVDLPRGRADLEANTCDMSTSCSGHYDRDRLLVGYLLQRRRLTVDELLGRPLDRAQTEAQLVADKTI
jgi:hypothetical protein